MALPHTHICSSFQVFSGPSERGALSPPRNRQSRSPALGEAVAIVAGGLLPAWVSQGWHLKFEVGREKALDKDQT